MKRMDNPTARKTFTAFLHPSVVLARRPSVVTASMPWVCYPKYDDVMCSNRNCEGQQWHPEHFVCQYCQKAFASGTFFEYAGMLIRFPGIILSLRVDNQANLTARHITISKLVHCVLGAESQSLADVLMQWVCILQPSYDGNECELHFVNRQEMAP